MSAAPGSGTRLSAARIDAAVEAATAALAESVPTPPPTTSAQPVPEDLRDVASEILRELWHRETGGHLALGGSDILAADWLDHLGARGLISFEAQQ